MCQNPTYLRVKSGGMIVSLIIVLLTLVSVCGAELLYQESFENTSVPFKFSTNIDTANSNAFEYNGAWFCCDENDDYFLIFNNSTQDAIPDTINWDVDNKQRTRFYSNQDGTNLIMAEDDTDGVPDEGAILTLDPVDITGKDNLQVSILVGAEPGWDRDGAGDYRALDPDDYIIIAAVIDGGTSVTIGMFSCDKEWTTEPDIDDVNGQLALDADMDGLGEGTKLNLTLQDFTFDVSSTGSSLVVKVQTHGDNATYGEEIAYDNIRVSAGGLAVTEWYLY